ncbi:hypothetical protein ACFOZ1_06725 [Gracilibacillus marinus]|uniref:Uncharacterized protein n=1 Tax=Gracilibacillus marinus TaxID=630535 RepID=A0ABV8VWP3_9BACI
MRNFRQSKDVVRYLEERYGPIKKHTIEDDLSIVNDICNHHSSEELQLISNRVKVIVEINKDTNYVATIFLPMMLAFFAAISTLAISTVTVTSNLLTSYFNQTIKLNEEKITQEKLSELMNLLDLPSFMTIAAVLILICFVLITLGVWYIDYGNTRKAKKLLMYKILIDEAIEKKSSI